jgi:hypothetical protein
MATALKINIGKFQIQVTGKTEEDLFEQVSFWAELPCECGKCKSKNIVPQHRRTGNGKDIYDFYELRCNDCRATYSCGQKKEGGLYPRGHKDTGEWEEEYKGTGQTDSRRDDRRDERRDDRGRSDDRRGERQDSRGGGRGKAEPEDDEDAIPF